MINLSELHKKWSPLMLYALAVSIFLSAIFFRFWVLPVEAGLAFLTFYPATVISFYLCGIRPGIVTVLLGAIAGYYIFEPPIVAVTIFLFSACLTGFVIKQMQNYAEQSREMLVALQQNELSHQSFLNDQTEVICRFKADGTILYVNDAFCRMFEKQREYLVGQKWHPVVVSEDIALINEKLNTLSPDNPVVTIENRVITADGIVRWGQFVNRAFFDEEGRLIEMQGVGRDITDRKLIEQAIQIESEKNEALLNAASDGVHILDEKGNVVQFSASFAHMLGYTHEEAAKLNVVDWDAQIPADHLINEVSRLIRQPATFETKHRCKNGSIIDVEINAKGVELAGKLYLYASSRDITERKMLEAKVAHIAYHDILTGLPNRLLISDRLNQALAQAERSEQMLVVCYLDLDGFKPINDTFGHHVGDRLLVEIAKRMEESVRINDTIGRLGGDEFVMLLTDIESIEEYQIILQRVIAAINEPVILDGFNPVKVGASIGITLFPSDNSDPDTLLRHADQAMYQAKKLGRNRINIFGEESSV